MKRKISLLILPLIAAATAIPLSAAPAQQKKTDPAVAAAEAKAKADAAKRNELWNKFNTLRNEGWSFANSKDWDKANDRIKAALALYDQINALTPVSRQETERFGWIFQALNSDRKVNAAALRGYYETLIPKASGDLKADWINRYADLLKEQKLEKPEQIAKIKDSRYAVKDLSPMKKFAFLMDDGRLDEADKVIGDFIKSQTNAKQKTALLNQAINSFSGKQVYGSLFARKYYGELLNLTTDPDAKSALLTRWANYAEDMAILSDEDVKKLRDSRHSLPGVSPKARIAAYVSDICRSIDEAEIIEIRDKALALAGKDPALRFPIVKLFSTNSYPQTLRVDCENFEWYPEFFRKEMAADPGYDRNQTSNLWNDYMRHFRFGRYAEMEKELMTYVAGTKIRYAAALKHWTEYSAKRDLAKSTKDNVKFAELDKSFREERTAITDAMERQLNALETLAGFYHANAARYYNTLSPAMAKKEIGVLREKADFYLSCTHYDQSVRFASDTLFRIAEVAFSAKLYDIVRKCAEDNGRYPAVLSDFESKYGKTNTLWAITNNAAKYPYLLGFCAFEEGNYAECIRQLEPLVKPGVRHYGLQNRNLSRTNIFECLVRSYTALEDYQNALKYADKFAETSPWFMKANKRIQPQIDALRERAAAQAEAGKK